MLDLSWGRAGNSPIPKPTRGQQEPGETAATQESCCPWRTAGVSWHGSPAPGSIPGCLKMPLAAMGRATTREGEQEAPGGRMGSFQWQGRRERVLEPGLWSLWPWGPG